MGFPDPVIGHRPSVEVTSEPVTRFYVPVSDTQAYRQFGNAVVVDVIEHLAHSLVAQARLLRPAKEAA
jgi:DNA (cytosine-5)-methyltransferase 1